MSLCERPCGSDLTVAMQFQGTAPAPGAVTGTLPVTFVAHMMDSSLGDSARVDGTRRGRRVGTPGAGVLPVSNGIVLVKRGSGGLDEAAGNG